MYLIYFGFEIPFAQTLTLFPSIFASAGTNFLLEPTISNPINFESFASKPAPIESKLVYFFDMLN